MILQRDSKVRVWGWADNGEKVTVTFGNQSVSTVAKDGKFLVELAPLKASAVGQKLVIKGKNTIELDNVLVGDIYMCSGQSNMEWRLKNSMNGEEAVKNANYYVWTTNGLLPAGYYDFDADGKLVIEDLPIGDYVIKVTEVPDNYNKPDDYSATVEDEKTTDVIIDVEKKKGDLDILVQVMNYLHLLVLQTALR